MLQRAKKKKSKLSASGKNKSYNQIQLTFLALSASICLEAPKVVLGIVPTPLLAVLLLLTTDPIVLEELGAVLPIVPVFLTALVKGLELEAAADDKEVEGTGRVVGLKVEVAAAAVVELAEEGRILAVVVVELVAPEARVEAKGLLVASGAEEDAIEDLTLLVPPVPAETEGLATRTVEVVELGTAGLVKVEVEVLTEEGLALTVDVVGALELVVEAIEDLTGAREDEVVVVVVVRGAFRKGAFVVDEIGTFLVKTTSVGIDTSFSVILNSIGAESSFDNKKEREFILSINVARVHCDYFVTISNRVNTLIAVILLLPSY